MNLSSIKKAEKPVLKNKVIIEIELLKAVIDPGMENEFLKSFERFGETLRTALLTSEKLETKVSIRLQ